MVNWVIPGRIPTPSLLQSAKMVAHLSIITQLPGHPKIVLGSCKRPGRPIKTVARLKNILSPMFMKTKPSKNEPNFKVLWVYHPQIKFKLTRSRITRWGESPLSPILLFEIKTNSRMGSTESLPTFFLCAHQQSVVNFVDNHFAASCEPGPRVDESHVVSR